MDVVIKLNVASSPTVETPAATTADTSVLPEQSVEAGLYLRAGRGPS